MQDARGKILCENKRKLLLSNLNWRQKLLDSISTSYVSTISNAVDVLLLDDESK